MKANSKISQVWSKGLLMSLVLFCSMQGIAQSNAVLADPKLGRISFTDLSGYQVDEAYLQPGELIKLRVPVLNNNHGRALPEGSCKIKIGFGSKLALDPSFDLNAAASNSYFTWTAAMNSGQLQVTGELTAPLPADVDHVDVAFKVKGTVVGKSTITANFLITNHNTFTVVSDEDGSNNAAYLQYTVTNKPVPVSVTKIDDAVKEGCSVNLSFSTNREINLARYEVEVSKDGAAYQKVASLNAAGNLSYTTAFEIPSAVRVQKLMIRILSVDKNGRLLYSESKTVNGLCEKLPVKLGLYPNPVSGAITKVVITASQGMFDGKYKLKVLDMAGKVMMMKDVTVSNAQNFTLELGALAGGKYLIQVSDSGDAQLGLLKFEKL